MVSEATKRADKNWEQVESEIISAGEHGISIEELAQRLTNVLDLSTNDTFNAKVSITRLLYSRADKAGIVQNDDRWFYKTHVPDTTSEGQTENGKVEPLPGETHYIKKIEPLRIDGSISLEVVHIRRVADLRESRIKHDDVWHEMVLISDTKLVIIPKGMLHEYQGRYTRKIEGEATITISQSGEDSIDKEPVIIRVSRDEIMLFSPK